MTNRAHTIHSNITEKCPVLVNTWKLGKLQKKYTQNLTRRKKFKSKSDACLKSWYKTWHVVRTLIQNPTRRKKIIQNHAFYKSLSFKIMLFTKVYRSKSCFIEKNLHSKSCFSEFFFFEIVLFKFARKIQFLRILRSKFIPNVIVCVWKVFQNLPY